jgi:hypothetical protein
MGYTIELESDELWCKSQADAEDATKIIAADEWIHPYHLQVTPTECSSGDRKGDWFLEVDHFQGDHWHDYEAREVWLKLAPHMADGATLELQGEDGDRWRIRWQHGHVFEDRVMEVVWAVHEEITADNTAP